MTRWPEKGHHKAFLTQYGIAVALGFVGTSLLVLDTWEILGAVFAGALMASSIINWNRLRKYMVIEEIRDAEYYDEG